MKLNRGQEKAIRLLVKRCVTITLVALLMVVLVFLADKFLATRVVGPLWDLATINMNISYYKECESKYVGYQDTTQYSETITELTKMRKKNFYHSDDAIVANLSTQNSLIKMFLLMVSVVLIPVITVGGIFLIIIWYARTVIRFRISWKKSGRRLT
jgi:hypothetical protein